MSELLVERLTLTAKLPNRTHATDAGLDLYADEELVLAPRERRFIKTGLKLAIPTGYVGLVWDKGGLALSGLTTIAGVIDADYRGEILVGLFNLGSENYSITSGQKIAQLLIQKIELINLIEAPIDDQTKRGDGRFGSTGLN